MQDTDTAVSDPDMSHQRIGEKNHAEHLQRFLAGRQQFERQIVFSIQRFHIPTADQFQSDRSGNVNQAGNDRQATGENGQLEKKSEVDDADDQGCEAVWNQLGEIEYPGSVQRSPERLSKPFVKGNQFVRRKIHE